MEPLFFNLKDILEEQKNVLKRLRDTAREHNRALRRLDMGALKESVGREEGLAAVLRRQEEKRRAVAAGLAAKLALPEESGLSAFAQKAGPGLKEELLDLLDSMAGIAGELAETNEINGLLTRQAARINQVMIRVFSPAHNQVYAPDGKMREGSSLPAIDKKI